MTEPDQANTDTRRRRLLFRATHRGTFENDLLLGGFVRAQLDLLLRDMENQESRMPADERYDFNLVREALGLGE